MGAEAVLLAFFTFSKVQVEGTISQLVLETGGQEPPSLLQTFKQLDTDFLSMCELSHKMPNVVKNSFPRTIMQFYTCLLILWRYYVCCFAIVLRIFYGFSSFFLLIFFWTVSKGLSFVDIYA